MTRLNILIGTLALAAAAMTIALPQADALAIRGGQAELINRPDVSSQRCWGEDFRQRSCGAGPH